MNKLGISISYKRVIELEELLANAVCTRFESDGIVCPTNLHRGLFTVGALDNIDHNPSSTSAQGSFHGTGISVFQFPSSSSHGMTREPLQINPESTGKCSLPESYTNVPAVSCQTDSLVVPEFSPTCSFRGHLNEATEGEMSWINHGMQLLTKELTTNDYVSWAAFHASLEHNPVHPSALISLLPLFYEKAATL